MVKIFISHSTADGKIANKLMDLIQTQFSLDRDDFFMTSDEELVVGENWIEQIRVNMKDAHVVLAFITPSYLESPFCLCELGATWVNKGALIPVIIPPLGHNALKDTPYRAWAQSIIMNSSQNLVQLGDALNDKEITDKKVRMTRFIKRAEDFFEEFLDPFILKMQKRESTTPAAFRTLKEQYESLEAAYNEAEDELKKFKDENEKIRGMNSEELKAHDYSQMEQWDLFTEAVEHVIDQLDPLPIVVNSVLYQYYKNRNFGFSDQDETSQLNECEGKGYIYWDNGWFPKFEHPAIRKANKALMKLSVVINDFDEFSDERFAEEYNELLGLEYSPFWEKVLEQKIYHSTH